MPIFMAMECQRNFSSFYWNLSWESSLAYSQPLLIDWCYGTALTISLDTHSGWKIMQDKTSTQITTWFTQKNYGIYNSLMDMYFNTATCNDKYRIKPSLYCEGAENLILEVEKKLESNQVVFKFTPIQVN